MRAKRGDLWRGGPVVRLRSPEARRRHEAMVGANIRPWLAEHGSPTWEPAEDHAWRDWIERHGDTYARGFLEGLDELVRREVAERQERDPEWQRQKAMVGAEIRSRLAEHGSPTWEPAEDHTWREWIEFQGDAFARCFLGDLDEAVRGIAPPTVGRSE